MRALKLILSILTTATIALAWLLFSGSPIVFAKYEKGRMDVNYQNGKSKTFYGSTGIWVDSQGKEVDWLTSQQLNELWDYNKRFGVPYPEGGEG